MEKNGVNILQTGFQACLLDPGVSGHLWLWLTAYSVGGPQENRRRKDGKKVLMNCFWEKKHRKKLQGGRGGKSLPAKQKEKYSHKLNYIIFFLARLAASSRQLAVGWQLGWWSCCCKNPAFAITEDISWEQHKQNKRLISLVKDRKRWGPDKLWHILLSLYTCQIYK